MRRVCRHDSWNERCYRSRLGTASSRGEPMTVTYRTMSATVLAGALLMTPASPSGQAAAEVFTATAAVKGAGGASANAPVTITIDRKMPQSEAEALVAAFKTGGAAALRKGLAG